MEYKHSFVSLDRIHVDDALFKISTGAVSAALVQSIQQVGLLNPPILLKCSGGYRIVAGFKRIAASRPMGTGSIAARLLDPATTIEHCIRIAIVDNTSQRSLNLVEQANAVALLWTVYPNLAQLTGVANLVGLSINSEMAGKLKKLAAMDSLMKSGVLDGSIALPVALQLDELHDSTAAQVLGTLLKELGLSLNRQREMLEWIVSICRRDDLTPFELVMVEDIIKIRRNKDLDRRQKGKIIRDYFKKRRYPTVLEFEQRFADCVRKLKLGQGTSLIPSPHFESPTYSLKFEFKNPSELSEKLKEFEEIVKSEKLTALWHELVD